MEEKAPHVAVPHVPDALPKAPADGAVGKTGVANWEVQSRAELAPLSPLKEIMSAPGGGTTRGAVGAGAGGSVEPSEMSWSSERGGRVGPSPPAPPTAYGSGRPEGGEGDGECIGRRDE